METKYIRDFRHNYLVLKEENAHQPEYSVKMITTNEIRGLIPCQERMLNGEALLYYDITSRQSICSILEAQQLQMVHLKKLFRSLRGMMGALEQYLLNMDGLLLAPEFVYMDMETLEYSFIYYPQENRPVEASFRELMDFFMQHMNMEDIRLTEAVYQVADLLKKQQFVMDEILIWFEESFGESGEDMTPVRRETGGMGQNRYESAVMQDVLASGDRNRKAMWEGDTALRSDRSVFRETGTVGEENGTTSGRNRMIVEEDRAIAGRNGSSSGRIMEKDMYPYEERESEERSLKGWLARLFRKESFKAKKQRKHEIRYMEPKELPEEEANTGSDHTVFIPWVENSDNKLYGIGRNNKYHIPMEHLPVTVGKMAGAVDVVLNEASVSRLHARISREGNRFFITDLNSTNGTFRNGMRLEPNASEIIEPGDEIGIGKLKFIYR